MLVITIPKPLREKLGDEASDSLVELLNKVYQTTKENIIELSADKFEKKLVSEMSELDKKVGNEISRLEQKIIELEQKMMREISRLEQKMIDEVSKLRVEMARNHASLIRWMFIFWIGQIGAIIGILLAFFK